MPRVSVIMPTFNCARFLPRALESVFAQTFTDYEVIVADDGSTDDTREVLAPYSGKITYLFQPNRGPSSARNLALSKASGEFIAYLDADDMWYPHKLERQVAFLDAHREYGLLHSDASFVDESDRILFHAYFRERPRTVARGSCLMQLLRKNSIHMPTVLEKRECVERVGRFDERLRNGEDYLHWILVAMEGVTFAYIDEPLALYRKTTGSLSSNERGDFEGVVTLFGILLDEQFLALRCGQGAAEIVRDRLYAPHRELAYLERTEGSTPQARRRLISLIREWPLRSELYVELLKSCVPFALATRIRTLKARWA